MRTGFTCQVLVELQGAGVSQSVGAFTPVASQDVGDGWAKHSFVRDGGNGPICIRGTPFSAFTEAGNPTKLLFMRQGGRACWQDFYRCNILAEAQEPPPPRDGIWGDSLDTGSEILPNPIGDWSIVYLPSCDGSVFSGDNDVFDADCPFGPVRFHRGLRKLSAGVDRAKASFPQARKVLVAGSSAGASL